MSFQVSGTPAHTSLLRIAAPSLSPRPVHSDSGPHSHRDLSALAPCPCPLPTHRQDSAPNSHAARVPSPAMPWPWRYPQSGCAPRPAVSPAQLCAQSSCVQAARGCCRKYRLIGRNPRLSGLGWPCSDPTTLSGVGLTVQAPGACCRGPGGTAPHALPRACHPLPTFTVDASPSPLTCPAALSPQPGILRCGSAPGSHPCHAEAPKPRSQGVSCLSLFLPPPAAVVTVLLFIQKLPFWGASSCLFLPTCQSPDL